MSVFGVGTIAIAVLAAFGLGSSLTRAARAPCTLVPQLRDVTINQGLGAYSPLVNGKETLVRAYLSKPSCAGTGASIQVTGGTLTVRDGGTTLGPVTAPTPVPVAGAYPEIASYSVAPMADSTGDPKFVVPAALVTRASAFTASFSVTITFQQRESKSASYANGSVTFSTLSGTNTAITKSFDQPSDALGVLFVPMGDGSKTYSTQWTTTGQQALQDGMTAAVAREYPLPAAIGNLGGTGGLRYAVAPTLLDLKRLGLLDSSGKFCGTGGNYDKIKAELAQFRLSYNTANPNAQANRVVGVIDPSIALLPPNPCFEGMAVVNSQEAWAVAVPGRAGQLIGLELAHTFGLVPPNRESPFDGAHSQNVTAENPQVNRRFNVVQRSFVPTDRSLMKPSATSPSPDNVNTLLEAPDFAFALCILGGTPSSECRTYGQPGSVDASAPVGSTLAFVMSGTTDGSAGICATCTGAATGTNVIESYFSSSVALTSPSPTSTYRFVQRTAGGSIVSDQGAPLSFAQSEHGTGSGTTTRTAGLFSFALPFQTTADRVELWKGAPGASGSLLLYAQNRTDAPVVTSFDVGEGPILLSVRGTTMSNAVLSTYTVTNTDDSGAGSLRQAIEDANASSGKDTITIDIPGSGVRTIAPDTALPAITDPVDISADPSNLDSNGLPYVRLDGSNFGTECLGSPVVNGLEFSVPGTTASTLSGLAFTRWTRGNASGVSISGTASVNVRGTLIGTDETGATGLGNYSGITVSNGSTIGGTASSDRNIISGNCLGGVTAVGSGGTIEGNWIGVAPDGSTALPNGRGVFVQATNITIGGASTAAGNRISGNSGDGVEIISGSSGVTVRNNEIDANGGLGIDLGPNAVTENDPADGDSGANDLQNFPVLASATATAVSGSLNSEPDQTYTIDVYASPSCDSSGNGEGATPVGSFQVTTNGSGDASFTDRPLAPSASGVVTATATDSSGNTSEVSDCVTVSGGGGGGTQPGPTFTVNTNTDPSTPLDSGCTTDECTLREAIAAANAAEGDNTIEFGLPGDTQIAVLGTALPTLTSPVLIDGFSQPEGTVVINGDGAGAGTNGLELASGSAGSEIRGLEIRDFSGSGIRILSADNTIVSNTIHDTNDGILVSGSGATGNVIGADVAPDELGSIDFDLGNVLVSNDSDGLEISGGATETVMAGNFIGTDRAGATDLGNGGAGIRVAASGNQLGPGNTVAQNGSIGTGIHVESGSGNRIVANSIHDNLGLGIALNEGANNDLGAPTLGSATSSGGTTTIQGSISGPPDGDYFVEFFENPACDPSESGEGETYLDFATVSVSDSSASFSKSLGGLSVGDIVTATLASTATDDTSEFSNCVTVEEEEELPPGQESWDATATDDNAGDLRLDGFLDCPGQPFQVIFVGRAPDSVSGNTASWSGTIDTSLAPPSCAVKIAVNDGFTRPPITDTGTETAATGNNPVVAAISSPRPNAQLLQYGLIPLRGLILNAQGVLANSEHRWSVDGPSGLTRSGTGTIVDLQPPSGGWPAGTYTATLKKAGSTDAAESDSVTFSVLTDADNDGIPKSVEDACIGGDGDSDPLNAFGDKDNDGIPNASDPAPCTPATSYTAIVDVNPDPVPTGSSGNPITAEVRIPGRNVAQVLATSVRITRIADEDVSTNNDFKNISWTIKNGVGIAKFDRQKVVQWLAGRNIQNRVISITVSGNSGAPPWSFSGSDSVFVQG